MCNPVKDYKQLAKNIIFKNKLNIFWMLLLFLIKDSPVWIVPVLTSRLIDLANVTPNVRLKMLFLYGGIMSFSIIQNYFTHVWYIRIQSKVSRSVSTDLRNRICNQLQQLSILYHYRSNVGRLHSKIIRDIEIIEEIFRTFVDGFFGAITRALAAVIAIYLRAPIALVFFLVILFFANILRKRFGTGMKENSKLLRSSIENMSASVSNMMVMMPITRAHGLEDSELSKIRKKISEVYHKGINLDVLIAKFGALSFITFNLSQGIFLLWSIYMNFQGLITVGDIVLFNAFFGSVNASIGLLQALLPSIAGIRESLISVAEILNQPDIEQNENKKILQSVTGIFEFKNVSFNYPVSDLVAIKNVSMKIEHGQSLAFVGPSGSGVGGGLKFPSLRRL